jgi:hypothetical protein
MWVSPRWKHPNLSNGDFNPWFVDPRTCSLALKYRELGILHGFNPERVEQTRRLLQVSEDDLAIMCGMSRAAWSGCLRSGREERRRLTTTASACCYYLERLHIYETLYENAPKLFHP